MVMPKYKKMIKTSNLHQLIWKTDNSFIINWQIQAKKICMLNLVECKHDCANINAMYS